MRTATSVRPDLELTVTDSESRETSRTSRTEENDADHLRTRLISQIIPNYSWDCARDASAALISGTISVLTGIGASKSEGPMNTAWAIVSTITGLFTIGMTIYGITIRCCPNSQSFWFRQ